MRLKLAVLHHQKLQCKIWGGPRTTSNSRISETEQDFWDPLVAERHPRTGLSPTLLSKWPCARACVRTGTFCTLVASFGLNLATLHENMPLGPNFDDEKKKLHAPQKRRGPVKCTLPSAYAPCLHYRHYIVLHGVALYCIVLYSIAWYCTVLHCILY